MHAVIFWSIMLVYSFVIPKYILKQYKTICKLYCLLEKRTSVKTKTKEEKNNSEKEIVLPSSFSDIIDHNVLLEQ